MKGKAAPVLSCAGSSSLLGYSWPWPVGRQVNNPMSCRSAWSRCRDPLAARRGGLDFEQCDDPSFVHMARVGVTDRSAQRSCLRADVDGTEARSVRLLRSHARTGTTRLTPIARF